MAQTLTKTLVYDGYRRAEDGFLVSHLETEMLQIEHVATSSGTFWDDLPASGQFFCEFIERALRGIATREVNIR